MILARIEFVGASKEFQTPDFCQDLIDPERYSDGNMEFKFSFILNTAYFAFTLGKCSET